MTNLTFNEFSPGKFYVSRKPEEPPFALMVAPRHNAGRKWGIEYRNSNEPHFGHGFQRHPASREDAERDLEKSVSVCSDYQLGLVSKPGESYEESNRE